MFGKHSRRWGLGLLTALLAFALVGMTLAANPNERSVAPQPNVQDPGKINVPDSKLWVLDFKFRDPRLIKVDVPGRGQEVCWYLWYQVISNTGQPRSFI